MKDKPLSVEIRLLILFSRLVAFFPRVVVLGASWIWAWILMDILRFRRKVVLQNLSLAFPEKSQKERLKIARANYRHYFLNVLEIFGSLPWTREVFKENVEVHGLENVFECTRQGTGGYFLTSHLGNWEFAIAVAAASGVPLEVIVKRPRTEMGDRFLGWYRTRTGAEILFESGTVKEILRAVSKGRFVGFILDQYMGPPIGVPVKFFGQMAGTAAGLALLSELRPAPIIPVYSYRDESGKSHTVFEKPLLFPQMPESKDDRIYYKTQIFNDTLERHVKMHPEQWLWLHRRWKPFVGDPKWFSKTWSALSLLLALTLFGCATGGDTLTGIALPPEPTVETPSFRAEEEEAKDAGVMTPAPSKAKSKAKSPQKAETKSKKEPASTSNPARVSKIRAKAAYRIPFEVGERLEMSLNWMALPAGSATLEVRSGAPYQERSTFHLWGNVLSSRIVDAIYHVDNTIESIVDSEGVIPYKFFLHMFESKQKKETRVVFDHVQGKAHYWAKRLSEKWGNTDWDRTDKFVPDSQDMFSALYYARLLDYRLNEHQIVNVYENGENFEIGVEPVANEFVNSQVGAFQCWKLKVTVKLNNIFKPTGDLFLWLSDDSKKYPVKFDAKVKIGSLYGNLTSIRERL